MKSKVYFTSEITPEAVLKLYKRLRKPLPGKVAIKVHSGEPGNQNFLRPDFWKPMVDHVGGTIVECNTAYTGGRHDKKHHMETFQKHGWLAYFPVDLLDAEGPDLALDIPGGKVLSKNYVGKDIVNYESTLILSHFKGHPMGGFGGAVKQLSIGVASAYGKRNIHGGGHPALGFLGKQEDFLYAMADAASSVVKLFDGKIAYINAMMNMSVDCDCCAVAEDPCIADIGILASLDPVAIDKACLDLVYACTDPGRPHLVERIESRNGALTLDAAQALGIGSQEYTLVEV